MVTIGDLLGSSNRELYRVEQLTAELGAVDPVVAGGVEDEKYVPRLLTAEMRKYFRLIGGRLYAASPVKGDWIPMDGRHRDTVQVVAALLGMTGLEEREMPEARVLREIAASCQVVAERAEGILSIPAEGANRVPTLALKEGVLDLRYGAVLPPLEAMGLNSLRTESEPVEYRPELAEDAPAEGLEFLRHFGKRLFRRLAYQMLKADKTIDVIRIDTPDAGKTTLTWMLVRAFPGLVDAGNAKTSLAGHTARFSRINRMLAECCLFFMDEADKADGKHLGPSDMNRLADRYVDIERKGKDAVRMPRRGNVVFLGNNWPPLELGLGSEARFVWAYHIKGEVMPRELAVWCETEQAVAWFRAHMAGLMREVWSETHELEREYIDMEGRETAERMLEELADPMRGLMRELFEEDEEGWISNRSIRAALSEGALEQGLDAEPPKTRDLQALVQAVFPGATVKRQTENGKTERGYRGLSRRGV